MRKYLPVFCFLFLIFLQFFIFVHSSFAQMPTPSNIVENTWAIDPEVTFTGKIAARAAEFFDWTIRSYKWSETSNNLTVFWSTIRNIIYTFLILFVLITAFILIITQGKNVAITRFIPKFIGVLILITFSFALIQFIYQITDIIQEFFLRKPDPGRPFISQSDLLYIGFNYKEFIGYRLSGIANNEAAFISLLLIKFTAATYYIMAGVLLVRKIILWFFIIISPIFPLLMLYAPIRNTAKVWIGEFFRWLLYGPLFAIFLGGIVSIWKSNIGIPLKFDFTKAGSEIVYPTAINILLAGPGQTFSVNNSLNLPDTFALYLVALMMLWGVIIMPFVLLKIFLNYFNSFSFSESSFLKQFINMSLPLIKRDNISLPKPPSPSPLPHPSSPTGMARSIPFSNFSKTSIGNVAPQSIKTEKTFQNTFNRPSTASFSSSNLFNRGNIQTSKSVELLRTANLNLPTIRDIARFESLRFSTITHQEINHYHDTLQKIASPDTITNPIEREKYVQIKEKLVQEKQKGDALSSGILAAANVSSTKASSTTTTSIQGENKQQTSINLPTVNKVQTVSLDDYEAVKKMWQESYQNQEVPKSISGEERTREEWIKSDLTKISDTINLLTSNDPVRLKQGMNNLSNILPFLLVGGFSQTEIIAYLKAKQEAGKGVLLEEEKKKQEEETKLNVEKKEEKKPKEMSAEVSMEEPNNNNQENSVYNKNISKKEDNSLDSNS